VLNPTENVCQYLSQTVLGDRVFIDCDDIIVRLFQAWQSLLAEAVLIHSITLRDWACVDQYL